MKEFFLETRDFDLELTLTCGQTFCWHRLEGELYGDGGSEFYTFRGGEPLIVRETDSGIEAETGLDRGEVEQALGLHHDLEKTFEGFQGDEKLERARQEFWGLRIVQDEFFPCLVSYLLSPQMQIPVIKRRFNQIAREYGETREVNGRELLKFPTREQLSGASEEDLRELGVGYRAKYVVESLKLLEDIDEQEIREIEYPDAREELKTLYGVGDKVADCVLLFSLGFHEACPLDTWAWRAVESQYPELHSEDYGETSRNLRERFGGRAGYALEYFFHAARNDVVEVKN